jgi:hypothetical protein
VTRTGRRIHVCFIVAGILALFLWWGDTDLSARIALAAGMFSFVFLGIIGAVAAALWDLATLRRRNREIQPPPVVYWRRDPTWWQREHEEWRSGR